MVFTSLLFVFTSSFMGLFPVANPIGNSLIINNFFEGITEQEQKIAIRRIIIYFVLISIGVLLIGHLFLLLFGLAIPVIQVGGGFLICRTALGLLSSDDTAKKDTEEKDTSNQDMKWKVLQNKLFYPISFPITIGPGTISVIFTLMATFDEKDSLLKTGINYGIIAFAIICIAVILFIFLSQGHRIMKRLGSAGTLIINKLIAFFTFCIGIQILVTGIAKIFHLNFL